MTPVFTMKGYEDYTPYVTYQRFFSIYKYSWKELWCPLFNRYANSMYVPIYNKELHNDISNIESNQSYIPTVDDRVFFMEECRISTNRYRGKFKFVNKIENADIVVIPDKFINCQGYIFSIIFANDENKELLIYPAYEIGSYELPYKLVNEDTFSDFFYKNISVNLNKSYTLSEENKRLCDSFKYVWSGFLIQYEYPQTKFILEELDVPVEDEALCNKKIKLCFESSLPLMFNNGAEEFTPEKIESLRTALNSEDKETVNYALNALTHMDYGHYPSVVTFLIYEHNAISKGRHNKEINFMKENLKKSVLPAYPFSNMNEREFPLLKKYVLADLNMRIGNTLKSFSTRVNVDVIGMPEFDVKLKDKQL